jgi:hypothetical protein
MNLIFFAAFWGMELFRFGSCPGTIPLEAIWTDRSMSMC